MVKRMTLKKAICLFELIMMFGILSACGGGEKQQRAVEDVGQEAAEMREGNDADEQAVRNGEIQTESVPNNDSKIDTNENVNEGTGAVEEPFDWNMLSVASEEDFEWEETYGGVKIKDYLGLETDIKVPATLNGKAVVEISPNAFEGISLISDSTNVRSIDFSDTSLRNIKQQTFYMCYCLERVALPDMSIGSIETNPFLGCPSLSEIILGEGSELEMVDGMVYDGTTLILRIPAFDDTDVIIREGTTEIGHGAFYMNNVVKVTMPDSVVSLNRLAFNGCTSLESITLSPNLTYISDSMFDGCQNLKEITIPEGVKRISKSAFMLCNSLENINLPSTLTEIDDYAFCRCDALKNITIPASVTSIGANAFSSCSALTDVYYGGSEQDWNTALEADVFDNIENITVHYNQ